MEQKELIVEEAGVRIDKWLATKEVDLSRMAILRMLEEGNITVNGKQVKPSYTVKQNDKIIVNKPEEKKSHIKAEDIKIEVVYEDDNMIVVNKPKGLVVHPGNGNPDGTLANAIMYLCGDSLSGIGGEIRPGIVHRLDKDTSGLLMIAKNDKTHIELSKQIANREVKKTYVALVRGIVKENEATIHMPIGRSTKDRKKMAVRKDGKDAITHFKVLQRFDGYTLLEIRIETGRTHQIRVHMSEIGYPVVGDSVYSNGKNPFGVEGQLLHAQRLEFKHPITKHEIKLEAQIPEEFENIIKKLEKNPV